MNCVFCQHEKLNIVQKASHFLVLKDKYPVTPGHILIIPKRHVDKVRELQSAELSDLMPLMLRMQDEMQSSDPSILGFNIGINEGAVAGQTVFHLHIHIIPRRVGDMADPRGGVRGVIPEKQKY